MEELKRTIKEKGKIVGTEIIKVDSFLNHQVDVELMDKIGIEFANKFRDKNITKVITIESSGIAPATMTAFHLKVPLLILKKSTSRILNDNTLQTKVHSFTKNIDYELTVSKEYIKEDDRILFIDDFLANGAAALGAKQLIDMKKAELIGIGIVIEKSFQDGRKKLEDGGLDVYSLARISKIENGEICFKD